MLIHLELSKMTFVINCKIIYKLDASNQGKEKVFSLFLEESLFLMKNSDKKKILALCTMYAPNLIELLKLFPNEKSYTLLAISIMVSIYSSKSYFSRNVHYGYKCESTYIWNMV